MDSVVGLKTRLIARKSKITYCSACNGEMHSAHILICAECLNDDCDRFTDLLSKEEDNEAQLPREE